MRDSKPVFELLNQFSDFQGSEDHRKFVFYNSIQLVVIAWRAREMLGW